MELRNFPARFTRHVQPELQIFYATIGFVAKFMLCFVVLVLLHVVSRHCIIELER